MKIFKILTHMSGPSFQKTHMYIQTLDNLRVPRPQATQYAESFCESSNSNDQILRKLQNKICHACALCCAVLWLGCVVLCRVVLCCVMLCYVVLCCVVLCCVVSCFVPLYLLKSLPRGNQVDGLPRATSSVHAHFFDFFVLQYDS